MFIYRKFYLILLLNVISAVTLDLLFANDELLINDSLKENEVANEIVTSDKSINDQPIIPKRRLINKIVARVNGNNILLSYLKKPRVNSGPFSLEDAIAQELYCQKAKERKILPTNLEIEKYLATIRGDFSAHNPNKKVTDEEFEKVLLESGFSLKSYKAEIFRLMAVSNLLGSVVRERVFVTAQEIERFYNDNPEFTDARYSFKTAIVPFSKAKTEEDVEKITDIDWVDSGWIVENDISEHLKEVTKLEKGETADPIKTKYGYQLIQLADVDPRRLKTLNERYTEMERRIRNEKMNFFEKEFVNELKNHALIEYL